MLLDDPSFVAMVDHCCSSRPHSAADLSLNPNFPSGLTYTFSKTECVYQDAIKISTRLIGGSRAVALIPCEIKEIECNSSMKKNIFLCFYIDSKTVVKDRIQLMHIYTSCRVNRVTN